MLFSFDINETLFIKQKFLTEYELNPTVAICILKILERGDVVLLNTSNPLLIKANKLMYDLLGVLYKKNSKNEDVFTFEQRLKIYQNIMKNFYIAQMRGACLRRVVPMNRREFEQGEKFDCLNPQDYIGVDESKVIYKSHISGKEILRLYQAMKKDSYFRRVANSQKFFTMDVNSVVKHPYIVEYFLCCPKSMENASLFLNRDEGDVFDENFEKQRINDLIKKMGLNLKAVEILNYRAILSKNEIKIRKIFDKTPQPISKELPIKVLQKMYRLNADECFHFGNEEVDIMDKSIAQSFIVGNSIDEAKRENLKDNGVKFTPNVLSVLMKMELSRILDENKNIIIEKENIIQKIK